MHQPVTPRSPTACLGFVVSGRTIRKGDCDGFQHAATNLPIKRALTLVAASGLISATTVAPSPAVGAAPLFALAGSYATGIGLGTAEIVAFDRGRVYVLNGTAVDVVDVANPAAPVKVGGLDVSGLGGDPTSVAAHNGLVAVAVPATARTSPGKVAFFVDGTRVAVLDVGSLPDMVTFTPDGSRVVVANEGEPSSYGQVGSIDPVGSVSIIDTSLLRTPVSQTLRGRLLELFPPVRTVGFEEFNVGGPRNGELSPDVRIFGPGASVAQDLEPEYIAVDPSSPRVFVTLQENNAVAEIDLVKARVVAIRALGFADTMSQAVGSMPATATVWRAEGP